MLTHAKPPEISVIIPSYNSRTLIRQCLETVCEQTQEEPFEVIIVDSSQDGTSDVVKTTYPFVKVIELMQRTFPGQARNIGLQEAEGQIIVFTDTDCVVDKNWLSRIAQMHRSPYRVIGGAVCNGTPASAVGTAEYLLEFIEFAPHRQAGEARLLPTCNVSLKREIFAEHGYFQNVIKGSDTLFTRYLIERGEKIYFTPTFQVYHTNRTQLKKFLRNQYELGKGSAQIRRQKSMPGSMLINHPYLIPFLPFFRLVGIWKRIQSYDKEVSSQYLRLSPIIFLGLLSYSLGFFLEVVTPEVSTGTNVGMREKPWN